MLYFALPLRRAYDMDKQLIYRKTPKGQDEMVTRAYRLPARERSVLVLVDGKRNGAELIDKGRHFGDSEAFLNHLIEAEFVEAVMPVMTATTRPSAASASNTIQPLRASPAAPSSPGIGKATVPTLPGAPSGTPSMALAIDFARHFLIEALGPDADALTVRIETSRNLRDLTVALEKSREALQVFAGRRKAELFWQELKARLPAGG
jgi:hypothetical protein